MPSSDAPLDADQLEDLQSFLKDWLRHTGRTQADLRRALKAASIRMPVLMQELQQIHAETGLSGLAERLCGIEETWRQEDDLGSDAVPADSVAAARPFGQLDLLLEEIRQERDG